MDNDKTVIATITQLEVDQVVEQDIQQELAIATLERMIGNYETYGSFNGVPKPSPMPKAS